MCFQQRMFSLSFRGSPRGAGFAGSALFAFAASDYKRNAASLQGFIFRAAPFLSSAEDKGTYHLSE